MAAPSRELAGAALARLRMTAAVTALVADRAWHRAPENAGHPHIAGFDTFAVRDDATGISGAEITLRVHVWTRDGIDPLQDARSVAHAVSEALHGVPLALPSNRLITLDHRGERIFYDPDGETGHGVVEFIAAVEQEA